MNLARNTISNNLEGQTLIIGREGHIYLGDNSISRHHAEISFADGKILLRDLDSTNGVYLVRNRRAVRIRQEYVGLHQPIVIGRRQCTVHKLLQAMNIASGMTS